MHRTSVPEAPVNEYADALSVEHNVRRTAKLSLGPPINFKVKTEAVKRRL